MVLLSKAKSLQFSAADSVVHQQQAGLPRLARGEPDDCAHARIGHLDHFAKFGKILDALIVGQGSSIQHNDRQLGIARDKGFGEAYRQFLVLESKILCFGHFLQAKLARKFEHNCVVFKSGTPYPTEVVSSPLTNVA